MNQDCNGFALLEIVKGLGKLHCTLNQYVSKLNKFSVYCDICSNLQIIVGGARSKVFKAINIPYFTRY